MRRCLNLMFSGLALSAFAAAAPAATLVYADISTDTNEAVEAGGSTDGTATRLLGDDITPISGHAGEKVTDISFKIYNNATTAVTFQPTLHFYASDGANAGPGTVLATVPLDTQTLTGNEDEPIGADNPDGIFTLPTGTFWAAISFAGAPAAALNELCLDVFNPPTVGSSANVAFVSTGPANDAANPAGTIGPITGIAVANFNWSFTTAPEPTSLGLLGGTVILAGRRRR